MKVTAKARVPRAGFFPIEPCAEGPASFAPIGFRPRRSERNGSEMGSFVTAFPVGAPPKTVTGAGRLLPVRMAVSGQNQTELFQTIWLGTWFEHL